ncbi:MAG TPA: hypothetical protein VI216_12915, partial [Candidatus Acidoferrales bacterium]
GPIFPDRFRSIHTRGDALEENAKAPYPHGSRTLRRQNIHPSGTARPAETDSSGQEREWSCNGPAGQHSQQALARERIVVMLDIAFVVCTALFFLVALAYVWACDRLN